jgi:hypothetical protein
MLSRKPDAVKREYIHDYSEIGDETSRLSVWIREQKETMNRDPGCFYLLDFAPRDIFIVRAKFPGVRIVGITVPGPQSEADIVKILATKKAVAAAAAATRSAEKK